MSRKEARRPHAHELGELPDLSPEVIQAAMRRGERLRSQYAAEFVKGTGSALLRALHWSAAWLARAPRSTTGSGPRTTGVPHRAS